MRMKKVVADTSIIVDGKISELIEKNEIEGLEEIIIPLATLDELQSQASKGRESGFVGLDELKNIRKLCEERKIDLRFTGERPSLEDIKLSKGGRLDALIRDVAKDENGTLLTADYVQALVGEAEGVKVEYLPPEAKGELTFKKFFTPDTMSIHLKEDVVPMAKRGKPGKFQLLKIGKEELTRKEIQQMINEIIETARKSEDSFIEAEGGGSVIVQLGEYRIAIARPPFSDGFEITVVKPIIKLTLDDYRLSEKLIKRLKEKAEGVLVAGPPGSGKSTFVTSMAEFYSKEKQVVIKTLESPRDLQVGPEITQYGPLGGDFAKTADVLLLVRPDYTIFDEIRRSRHFQIFADMRLAGVGMIGVVHSAKAIDAIQRFIGKVELGMIPHIIDTVIYLKDGEIKNVYELALIVKVPTGMTEADLARPVVEIRDFETGKLFYEIYTYGEENVVIPVEEEKASPLRELAKQRVKQIMKKYDSKAKIEFLSDNSVRVKVDNKAIARLIGKNGMNISKIEDELGIHIDVEPKVPVVGKEVKFELAESGNSFILTFENKIIGKPVNIYVESDFLMSVTVGKKNEVKINKSSDIGEEILRAIVNKRRIRVVSE